MVAPALLVLATAGLAAAHFQLEYPTWRGDSLDNSNYSQYTFPCAGVPADAWGANRTDWPATGGALSLHLHHTWSYLFINIGLGDNVTNFNYSLTPSFWNETGKGTLCLPHLDLPAGLAPADGQRATIQVVAVGESGSALYNCADITFRTATDLAPFGGANCTTDAGVSYVPVGPVSNASSATATAASASGTAAASSTGTSAGAAGGIVDVPALTMVVSLAMALMYGMGL